MFHRVTIEEQLGCPTGYIEGNMYHYISGSKFRACCYCGWCSEYSSDVNRISWEAFDHEREYLERK